MTVCLGCSKKYTTQPQLNLKGISTTILHPGDSIQFTFEATGKNGDFTQLYVEKQASNCTASSGILITPIPPFLSTKDQKATLYVKFGYESANELVQLPPPQCGQNDTCTFRFALTDGEGDTSDTLNTPTIILVDQ